jgi:aspartyl-tRNA synthetase
VDGVVEVARGVGAKGLVWVAVTRDGLRSPLDKFFTDDERAGLVKSTGADAGDLILVVADAGVKVV